MIKKFSVVLLFVLVVLSTCLYGFIAINSPKRHGIIISTAQINVFNFLTNKKRWQKWWPGKVDPSTGSFSYKQNNYFIKKISNSGVVVAVSTKGTTFETTITFSAAFREAVSVQWVVNEPVSLNPVQALSQAFEIKSSSKNMDDILAKLKSFLENDYNVYNIDIKVLKVKDSLVLTTHTLMPSPPSTTKVYQMIDLLKQQINGQRAVQTDPPMLNVHQTGLHEFDVMVGIPINKPIIPRGNAFINKMVLGNILVAKVKGGLGTVDNANAELENYRRDYELISPAMPFQSLEVNRSEVADTSKWVTDLYYPIF